MAAEIAATGDAAGASGLIDQVLRRRRADRLGRLATCVEQLASWDDLVLLDDVLDSVHELVARVRLRSMVLIAAHPGAFVSRMRGSHRLIFPSRCALILVSRSMVMSTCAQQCRPRAVAG